MKTEGEVKPEKAEPQDEIKPDQNAPEADRSVDEPAIESGVSTDKSEADNSEALPEKDTAPVDEEAGEAEAAPAGEETAEAQDATAIVDVTPREGMAWYVLHAYSGYEKKVRDQLYERLRQNGLSDSVGDILVPEEDVVEIKRGKKKISTRMFFPGYVLIEMAMNEKVWYVVKETPRITGFLGDAHMPVPLGIDEVRRIKEQMVGVADKPRPKHSYNVGEPVRVTEGPFANFSGVLEEVNMERGKVKVMVSIFGRSTPVELEFSQIEKI
ncbi:Transcription antitermination protein NusG [hydrothermal vent metagenome]|uniref:Transcription antitermination protein NusG n=2 Tax=hydrothermal vent metagenome TaxID=652676 RepID=A0A3B1CBL8_9ZZZZ